MITQETAPRATLVPLTALYEPDELFAVVGLGLPLLHLGRVLEHVVPGLGQRGLLAVQRLLGVSLQAFKTRA